MKVGASEPCSRAALRNVRSLFSFIDNVTSSKPPILQDRFVGATFKEVMAQAPARRSGNAVAASRYPVAVVVANGQMFDERGRVAL